ncbi:MAG TPA: hypothetical protein VF376_14770 [Thermoanaerobaculia bacterium]
MRSRVVWTAAIATSLFAIARGSEALPGEPAKVEGGDPAISGSFLQPYTNRWRFTMTKPGSAPVEAGTWSDRMETTSFAGRPVLKRTQVAEYKNGIRLTFVNVFDPKTMDSLAFDYVRSDTGETRHLEVEGKTVHFRRSPGTGDQPAQDYDARVDRRILDYYDGLFGILLDSLPLKEGYEIELPAFDSDRAAIDWVHVRVTGRETVPAGEGKQAGTWVVHVETKLYGSSTWWLSREKPYVIAASLVLAEKDGGTVITYTMI